MQPNVSMKWHKSFHVYTIYHQNNIKWDNYNNNSSVNIFYIYGFTQQKKNQINGQSLPTISHCCILNNRQEI